MPYKFNSSSQFLLQNVPQEHALTAVRQKMFNHLWLIAYKTVTASQDMIAFSNHALHSDIPGRDMKKKKAEVFNCWCHRYFLHLLENVFLHIISKCSNIHAKAEIHLFPSPFHPLGSGKNMSATGWKQTHMGVAGKSGSMKCRLCLRSCKFVLYSCRQLSHTPIANMNWAWAVEVDGLFSTSGDGGGEARICTVAVWKRRTVNCRV